MWCIFLDIATHESSKHKPSDNSITYDYSICGVKFRILPMGLINSIRLMDLQFFFTFFFCSLSFKKVGNIAMDIHCSLERHQFSFPKELPITTYWMVGVSKDSNHVLTMASTYHYVCRYPLLLILWVAINHIFCTIKTLLKCLKFWFFFWKSWRFILLV